MFDGSVRGLWAAFMAGGFFMWPLLLCSIVAIAIAIQRYYHLSKARIDTDKLMENLKASLRREAYEEATGICKATPGPVASVLQAVIALRSQPDDVMKEGVKEAALTEIPRLERMLNALSTVVTVAPLLGLLGTISGLIHLFNSLNKGVIAYQQLPGGIQEALITTAFGLIIAIPALIIHNNLQGKVDKFINEMEKSTVELTNFLRTMKISGDTVKPR